jgi:2-polyprenyl-3-methyl-5-hydroxy-6-metoxy-1,4-benzoquinol methylase
MTKQDYSFKSIQYFNQTRLDILPLMPLGKCERVLEIGCGNGATLAYLKENGISKVVEGIELVPSVILDASENIDKIHVGEVERLLGSLMEASYDVVLCLDVLEHLIDPWAVISQIERVLKPGGVIIASIPNVRTFRVIWNLGVRGQFDYADQGIMDRTHLRFFTRKTALELLSTEVLHVEKWRPTPLARWSKSSIANYFTLGLFRDFFSVQFLVRAIKRDS